MLLGDEGAPEPAADVYLAVTAPSLLPEAFRWKLALIGGGVRADADYDGRSLKSQLRRADRSGAKVVIVLGEDEARRGTVGYRDMTRGTQEEIPGNEAMRRLLRRD